MVFEDLIDQISAGIDTLESDDGRVVARMLRDALRAVESELEAMRRAHDQLKQAVAQQRR